MKTLITVIICTHNPRRNYLSKVLEELKYQTLPMEQWELLLIDNASDKVLASEIDLSWHPNANHVREEKLGLTAARIRGFYEAKAKFIVFVDDDNVLEINYLKNTIEILQQNPDLGAVGGKSLPEFETEPEPWTYQFSVCLALRDLGDEIQVYSYNLKDNSPHEYPICAPIGAGLVLRQEAFKTYVTKVTQDNTRLAFGRTGKKLISGEDNDIVLTLLEAGWEVAYYPQLKLTHLITATRLTKDYLARLNYASSRSWIQVLDAHKIQPWQKIPHWTVLPRKIKAFLVYQAWKNPANYVCWKGACGHFEGLSTLQKR